MKKEVLNINTDLNKSTEKRKHSENVTKLDKELNPEAIPFVYDSQKTNTKNS